MTFDPALISFRRLTVDDLPLMHRWLNTDHVARWYDANGGRWPSHQQVAEKYAARMRGEAKTEPFLILHNDEPVGYIQSYLIADHPEYARVVQVEAGAAGVDLFIGEADLVYRGLGPHILRRFLNKIVFADPGVTSCVIGPSVSNAAAIRAYEKAGFKHLKTVHVAGEPEQEYLMRIALEDVIDVSSDSSPR